jgi:hypothetical protein
MEISKFLRHWYWLIGRLADWGFVPLLLLVDGRVRLGH